MLSITARSGWSRALHVTVVLASAVAVLVFAAGPATAASGDHFKCRASALRVLGAGVLDVEPEVANQSNDPCASGQAATASVNLPSLLSATAGPASTTGTVFGGSAASQVANVNVLALGVTADAASAHAGYACSAGSPVPTAGSSVVNLSIGGGAPITTSGPVSLKVGGIADVELNRTITSASSITQRAVDITVFGGPYNGAEIVLGEASAGLSGNPCDVGTTGLLPPGVQGGPPSSTPPTSTFVFTFQPGTTLQCSLDSRPFTTCTATTTFTNLSIGWHVLSVRELLNGVAGPVFTFRWKVTRGSAAGCPRATGGVSGRTLGRVSLGMTRLQTRRAYRLSSSWSTPSQDFFCLKPIGVRVEYASGALLGGHPAGERRALLGRVVLALTANTHYALDGIRHGAMLRAARRALGTGNLFHIGINWWYFVQHGSWTAVLKLHHGIVAEVGIADRRLTNSRRAQLAFIRRSR
ncbi:MAG: hypothetical protein M3076_08670 [Actinomycetota bacterium]|nr:hypothetical protein [Actinomycetota bacterium]